MIAIPLFAAVDNVMPQMGLIAYYPFTNASLENAIETDAPSIVNYNATFGTDRFGHENSSAKFSGENNVYMEINDNDKFSIITTGSLSISVWVSPEVLTFKNAESGGYVHWMGKGMSHQHEWVFRMYNKELTNSQENRPNRISAYAFNLEGGLGSGSYVQESLTSNEWIHIVVLYDVSSNKIRLYKNAIKKDEDDLFDATYGVQVQNGTSPVRLGTRSLWSFFQGRIDDLRFYNRVLTETEITILYNEKDPYDEEISSSSKIPQSSSSVSFTQSSTSSNPASSGSLLMSSSSVRTLSSSSEKATSIIRRKNELQIDREKSLYDLKGRKIIKQ